MNNFKRGDLVSYKLDPKLILIVLDVAGDMVNCIRLNNVSGSFESVTLPEQVLVPDDRRN
jgi:hypothetical protein